MTSEPLDTSKPLETPVLLITYKRPETTLQVIEAIRKVAPMRLFFASNCPPPGDVLGAKQCTQTRALVNMVDWECDVRTLLRENHLSARMSISSAIDWFFENVTEGIILEDDCLPSVSFFYFCQRLLERYRDDSRIFMISGDNLLFGKRPDDATYYFSRTNHIWGWASWRRAWSFYDVEIRRFPEFTASNLIDNIFDNRKERRKWMNNFTLVYEKRLDTWDHQWAFAILSQNGLSVMPNHNMISNIGFGASATHTGGGSIYANLPTVEIEEIVHPLFVVHDRAADRLERKIYRSSIPFATMVRNKILQIMGRW